MGKLTNLAWKAFEKTGGVKEYLKYKTHQRYDMEVGEEIGIVENPRDCNKNHKIQ